MVKGAERVQLIIHLQDLNINSEKVVSLEHYTMMQGTKNVQSLDIPLLSSSHFIDLIWIEQKS